MNEIGILIDHRTMYLIGICLGMCLGISFMQVIYGIVKLSKKYKSEKLRILTKISDEKLKEEISRKYLESLSDD